MLDSLSDINRFWTALTGRADLVHDPAHIYDSFVEATFFTSVLDRDSMVLFGRRGAGKTHTLLELHRKVRESGDVAVYVDMRFMGSNSGIYNDPDTPFSMRSTRLMVDMIERIHDSLLQLALVDDNHGLSENLHTLGPALDLLAEASTQVRVQGTLSVTHEKAVKQEHSRSKKAAARLKRKGLSIDLTASATGVEGMSSASSITEQGERTFYLHLGSLQRAIRSVVDALGGRRLWLLIDEWSTGIPLELQPILSDMLRRTFMCVPSVTIKIMAIEHRSCFRKLSATSGPVDLELGADTAETVVLDEALNIGSESAAAIDFIRRILSEHFMTVLEQARAGVAAAMSTTDVVKTSFQANALETLVLASEGNPRDAMNLVSKAAREAGARAITTKNVLEAAHDYFWNTKYKNIEEDHEMVKLFSSLMSKSLYRGRRTFLVARHDANRAVYNRLYDERLIHLIRSGMRIADAEGTFDGYAIDFGSYAHQVMAGKLRWSNDGWASARSFYVAPDSSWRDSVAERRPLTQSA